MICFIVTLSATTLRTIHSENTFISDSSLLVPLPHRKEKETRGTPKGVQTFPLHSVLACSRLWINQAKEQSGKKKKQCFPSSTLFFIKINNNILHEQQKKKNSAYTVGLEISVKCINHTHSSILHITNTRTSQITLIIQLKQTKVSGHR